MSTNPMTAGLAAGRPQFGAWIHLAHRPAALVMLKAAGLDFVLVDMEHEAPSIETVATLATVARGVGLALIVRPPSSSREWIARLLAAGVGGFRIPNVATAKDVAAVVDVVRFPPLGTRGFAPVGAYTDYVAGVSHAEMDAAVHVTVMLESPEAFANLEAIAATPGIDALAIGPGDLALELGVLGTPDQRRIIDEHVEMLRAAALRNGKDVALRCASHEEAAAQIAAGVRIIAFPSDVELLQQTYGDLVAAARAVG